MRTATPLRPYTGRYLREAKYGYTHSEVLLPEGFQWTGQYDPDAQEKWEASEAAKVDRRLGMRLDAATSIRDYGTAKPCPACTCPTEREDEIRGDRVIGHFNYCPNCEEER